MKDAHADDQPARDYSSGAAEKPQHLTADELYERVKKSMPRISLATVYRNLETLSETGVIAKLEISGRQKRFDSECI